MPGLRDLPDEVILLTAGLLGAADLAALTLSCRRLHAVAEEALYTQNRDLDGSSAVCWAAANGNIATLDKAWKHRLNVNEDSQVIPRVSSPLVNAVKHGQDSAVIWLLDHGADIAQEVRARTNCRRVAHEGNRTSILHIAMCLRHVSTAHLLITRGAPLEYPAAESFWPDLETTDALIEACSHGLDTVVKVLVKDYGMDPQTRRGSACRNVLVCAARDNRNVSTIKTLVALGVNVDGDRRNWTQSPLHAALGRGNFDIAHTLLDLGANVFPYEYYPKIDTEGDGGISSKPIQVQVAPLHDTIATIGSSAINRTSTFAPGETAERWQAQRAAFMQRLIELGTDIDAKVVGDWAVDRWEDISPLGVANAIGEVKAGEVADLIALGAKVDSKMVQYAYAHLDSYHEESLKKIKLLLRHGARVDEPIGERDMSLLQLAIEDANENGSTAKLHEILLMCSPKNLHSHHLDQGLEECLLDLNCDTSSVLVRHGARVSCRDELYLIAGAIAAQLKFETGQVEYWQDIEDDAYMSCRDIAARDCMGIVMDMGLSNADQCLVFSAVLRKRKVALTHLFLDRGLAGTAEAVQYLPSYLMDAASWATVCVIKRLWQHAHEALDTTLRLLLIQRAIISHNREAVRFFMDHGATPFEPLTLLQIERELGMRRFSQGQCFFVLQLREDRLDTVGSPDHLRLEREQLKLDILEKRHRSIDGAQYHLSPFQLAVRHGQIDIVSDLLEHINQADKDAISRCGKVYIPCVLEEANEIRELIRKRGIECDGDNTYAA